ncbi:MAG: hypothetical protein KF718_33155 [Polyangiaceae bacterium]|nr:hypothetical protein [Polyangiaceae bacterium]
MVPSEDETGDNVRISWELPLPITLSRRAKALLPTARLRPLPPAVATEIYAERTAALTELVKSPPFRALLHARDGVDALRLLQADPTRRAVTFQHYFFDARDGTWAQVAGAQVALHLTPDGIGLQGVTTFFQPDLDPPPAAIGWHDARRIAVELATEWGAANPFVALEPGPVVIRDPAPFGGARPASQVRRGGDRKFFRARVTDQARQLAPNVQVLIDAETGKIGRVRTLSSQDTPSQPFGSARIGDWVNLTLSNLPALLNQLFCTFFDGTGLDLDNTLRTFSTTLYPPSQVQDDPSRPYAMVSCDETAPGRSFIDPLDIITFAANPHPDKDLVNARVFRDDDNVWSEPPTHPKRHAVAAQFWSERVLGFFRSRGYWKRDHAGVGNTVVPARVLSWYGAPIDGLAESRHYFLQTTSENKLLVGNSLLLFSEPTDVFRTSVDLFTVGHEFAHSFTWDVAYAPGETGQAKPLAGFNTESYSIDEGIADCLSMLMLAENIADLGPRYKLTGVDAPFHLGADLYDNPDLGILGFPNLANPWHSEPRRFTYWSGERDTSSTNQGAEDNSTLVGGPCKLLITGGSQPRLASDVLNVPQSAVSLGGTSPSTNRPIAYARLSELLFYTWLETRPRPRTAATTT